jgi:hypothetical protein
LNNCPYREGASSGGTGLSRFGRGMKLDRLGKYREKAQEHLAQFRQDVSAEARLAVFRKALKRS